MKIIIIYYPNGRIYHEEEFNKRNLCLLGGMKVRFTLNDGTQVEGYAGKSRKVFNAFYCDNFSQIDELSVYTYDYLDKDSGWLLDEDSPNRYDITERKIAISDLKRAEAILWSNPRWGTPPSNTFDLPDNPPTDDEWRQTQEALMREFKSWEQCGKRRND